MKKLVTLLIILIASAGLSFLFFWLEMGIADWTRWKWFGNLLIIPGWTVQNWLVSRNPIPPPQTGGHMPDMGYTFLFDLVVNWILAFCALFIFEHAFRKRRIREEQR